MSLAPSESQMQSEKERDDLALLVGRLIRRIQKDYPGDEVAAEALNYLKRHRLVSLKRGVGYLGNINAAGCDPDTL